MRILNEKWTYKLTYYDQVSWIEMGFQLGSSNSDLYSLTAYQYQAKFLKNLAGKQKSLMEMWITKI